MDEKNLNHFKARLEQLLVTLRADAETADEAAKPVELDQATVGRLSRMDAMQGQAMAIEALRRRHDLERRAEQALARIAAGEFGICMECGEEISLRRLEADPVSTLCISCAGAREAAR
jgi:DnaK suppressor protein